MISSYNEWDPLKSVVVGTATYANWPTDDPVFAEEGSKTLWTETPVPSGPVPQHIIDEANEDLQALCDILVDAGVVVHRPRDLDFVARGGMYNYCPRDRLLIAGTRVIDPAMMYPCRNLELEAYYDVILACDRYARMPRAQGMVMDAANVDLKAFTEAGLVERRREVGKVQGILMEEIERFQLDRTMRTVAPLVVKDKVIAAPPNNHLVLPGTTNDVVMELLRKAKMNLVLREVSEDEVRVADELWLTSATKAGLFDWPGARLATLSSTRRPAER